MQLTLVNSIKQKLRHFEERLAYRMDFPKKTQQQVIDEFTRLYFDARLFGKTWTDTHWLGIETLKCPLDLWVYQEIIFEARPDVIIETGTYKGGSGLFLANICDLVSNGHVVTIDVEDQKRKPQHESLTYLIGSSTSQDIVGKVRSLISPHDKVMAILDSDHREEYVLNELRLYGKLVTMGNYLIVEDTIQHGHPVVPHVPPGPMEAVDKFLAENSQYVIDRDREKFYLTFNRRGYLKRIA